jgi:hypothetical protein
MPKLDTLTGKWKCEVTIYDDDTPAEELIGVVTGPVFSSERDAELAEELALDVYAQAQLPIEDRRFD